ncbi:GL24816 [Drosophila persimilis]|uniref:Adenine phosphoribosyltransferase n=2 Tax=pseudoobscura subgroup TaxID=32358 RepID=A0A6I8W4M5_DROPS|nr:adenine phosphoribosyltransferase [Drosophila persimilis]XP_033238273.1 adenine phosphoribosyltransferase [Drosophila pseudoobscura]EDW40570.1 GL24816 [Drosophila persimilis]
MSQISAEDKLDYVKSKIGEYPNFPKEGILFRDIFGALTDPKACVYLRDLLVQYIRQSQPEVEVIVGLDSRGFLFNLLLATELGVGCAPIRKKGKLAGEVVSVEYQLEYGSDTFELQRTAIQPGQKVVIVDDLLATGGSLLAASELVRKVGGVVLESLVVMELVGLDGRKKLDCKVHSLIKY